eukprot:TRINITY_DN1778_c0_g1_i9.p1 TRINITY_DN1778_c0_g1~~TRINITY_DN1778_c0_g1_i9.p1  ORF type:complete len:233 (+),score=36.73 TRINITY_DN1778_c0_g1_i9:327-1025(+)
MAYFGTMNERLASPASHIDECSFRSVESTVLYHINYAAKQEHELGLDILRAFKTDRDLINSFSVSLILSLTKMHRFESNAIECLKMAVISDIKMSLQKSASEAHKPITESSILSALKQVVYGREELYPSFVQLGVSLLEVQKSITPADQEHNTQSPTEKYLLHLFAYDQIYNQKNRTLSQLPIITWLSSYISKNDEKCFGGSARSNFLLVSGLACLDTDCFLKFILLQNPLE